MASIKDESFDFGEVVDDDDELIINLPTEDYHFEDQQASNNNNNNSQDILNNKQVNEVIVIDEDRDTLRRSPRKKMRTSSSDNQINDNNEGGWSDIHQLSFKGNPDAVSKILDASPELLESLDSNKRTPLYVAAARGKTRIVELLAQRRASVECLNDKGYTPLFAASMYGHINTVKLLVKLGASTQSKCLHRGYQKEFTAEEIAQEEHKSACAKFLKSYRERKLRTTQLEASISNLEQQLENHKRELQTLKNSTDP